MVKTEPNITVDADTWQKFKTAADNASQELERFMDDYVNRDVDSVEDAEKRLEDLETELEALESEKAALEMKKQDMDNDATGSVGGWICYDCSETGPGDASEIQRCPNCHGDRVHDAEDDGDV